MLIVLPPSETKRAGGTGSPLELDRLSFASLNPVRAQIAKDLSALPVDRAIEVLKISARLRAEAQANTELFSSPTMPAIERYTGVLFDALDAASLPAAARSRITIGSALFGVVAAHDLIPHYRLSGTTKLPRPDGTTPTMKARWTPLLTEALSGCDGLIVDLRSGAYQQLGPVPGALTVRVESVRPDGSRKVVSHFNKRYKGQLARALALAPTPAETPDEVAAIAEQAGLTVELSGPTQLTVVVAGDPA